MIVLDTHVWLWWTAAPERLSPRAGAAIDEEPELGVSTISAWEVAMLTGRGRISLDRDVSQWVAQALAHPRIRAIAPSATVTVSAGLLDAERFPGDPADRLIYATARAERARLLTRDAQLRDFDPGGTLW